jgi:hypothetical protein
MFYFAENDNDINELIGNNAMMYEWYYHTHLSAYSILSMLKSFISLTIKTIGTSTAGMDLRWAWYLSTLWVSPKSFSLASPDLRVHIQICPWPELKNAQGRLQRRRCYLLPKNSMGHPMAARNLPLAWVHHQQDVPRGTLEPGNRTGATFLFVWSSLEFLTPTSIKNFLIFLTTT